MPGRLSVRASYPSTAGCLLALDRLARERRFRRPLDMGCGSGILTLALAKTWRAPVVACDIDDEAVRVTAANAALNGVNKLVLAQDLPTKLQRWPRPSPMT